MPGVLAISVDGSADPRIQYDRLAGLYNGPDWDMLNSGSVFVDYVTYTGMLMPLQFTGEWQTTGTGDYARLRKADYLLTTPSKWVEHVGVRNTGDYYLHSLDVNEVVYTGAAYPKNQPIFLSWFSFNAGNEDRVEMECGWTAPGNSVSLRFRSNGQVEVYKDNDTTILTVGNIIDGRSPYPTQYGTDYASTSGNSRMMSGQRVDVALIPCRGRELLVLSNQGGGFNYLFDDIDAGDANPTITQAGRFWWYVPEGQAQVQMAPMKFATTGYLLSPAQQLRYAPFTGATAAVTPYFGTAGYGAVNVAGSVMDSGGASVFVPNGTADTVRLRLNLSGDGAASPWVYGGAFSYAGSVAMTAGSAVNITSYVRGDSEAPRISVPESPNDVRLTLTIRSPLTMEGTVPGATYIANRPVRATIGGQAFFTGRNEAPRYTESISDEARRMILECRDWVEGLDKYLIQEPTPFDGVNLGTAISQLVSYAGFGTAYQDIDYPDFELPKVPNASQGEYAVLPEPGDSAWKWIEQLVEDYAATYYYGFKPTTSGPKFFFKGTASLGTVAGGTLYSTTALGGQFGVYRSYDEAVLAPEANAIWVMGQNPRTKLPIIAHYADLTSKDPTLAPASRPANWLGEERRYALRNPQITDEATATYAVGILRDRLTRARYISTWKSELLVKSSGVPAWRGDVWKLDGRGRFRIIAFDGDFQFEGGTESMYRDITYVGEYIGQ